MNPRYLLRRHSLLELITVAAFGIVTIGGAVISIVDPDALHPDTYLALVAGSALPAAIANIGRGIHDNGREHAGSHALKEAYLRGERHSEPNRTYDPATIPTPAELADKDTGTRYDPGT